MLATSEAYKAMVYSRDYARHFIPEVLIQVIDTTAREMARYSSSSVTFFNQFNQLTDEITKGQFDYGTLEDFQFLLDGTKRLMPSRTSLTGRQFGWCSEVMSDENGSFTTPVTLDCNYEKTIITAGRVIVFDSNYDSVPKDFTLTYFKKGAQIAEIPITDNESYIVNVMVPVEHYDHLTVTFYNMTRPYRRIHVVEDIPGLYFSFDETQVVSISLNQIVDIFSKELIAGEITFSIENAEKNLNILNDQGIEKYLQRRQPVDINLTMEYPDKSTETIPLGTTKLSEWKVPKGGLEATFTARDASDSLALDEYYKGVFPKTTASLYELAEAVLKDAGIGSYTIDIHLRNIYSSAPLPITTHKELLRMIAQAGMSVVLPQLDGGIQIVYTSPLVSATNLVQNPGFDSDWSNWSQSGCDFTQEYIYADKQSVLLPRGATLSQTVSGVKAGNQYYVRVYCTVTGEQSGSGTYFQVDGNNVTVDLANANIQIGEWDGFGAVVTASSSSMTLKMVNSAGSTILCDGFMCIDLTTTYGKGKEPTDVWCDNNIRFFNTVLMIPRVQNPNAVDTFDFYNLMDSPEITTSLPTKSVEVNIYSYKTATETSEVYKGGRIVSGTEDFVIKFNGLAKNCVVTVQSVDANGDPTTENTAVLLSSTIYAQAADLRVQASGEILITVTGYAVTSNTSQYKVDPTVDTNLIADAKAETIDNRLVTNRTVAEDVVSYALFWLNCRYTYDFDWRQNPAIELLDSVVVYDDFGKNNTVMLTERTIDYTDGVLGGSSKGIC